MKVTTEVPVEIDFTVHPGRPAKREYPAVNSPVEIHSVVFEETGEQIPESLYDAIEEDIIRCVKYRAEQIARER